MVQGASAGRVSREERLLQAGAAVTQITTTAASPRLTPLFFLWGHPLEKNPSFRVGTPRLPPSSNRQMLHREGRISFR